MLGQRSGGGLFVLLVFINLFFLLDLLTFYLQALHILFVVIAFDTMCPTQSRKLSSPLEVNVLNLVIVHGYCTSENIAHVIKQTRRRRYRKRRI